MFRVSFDYEEQAEYVFSIIVTDNGRTPRQSVPSTVTIAITNINDESPEFEEPTYSEFINLTLGKNCIKERNPLIYLVRIFSNCKTFAEKLHIFVGTCMYTVLHTFAIYNYYADICLSGTLQNLSLCAPFFHRLHCGRVLLPQHIIWERECIR